MAMEGSSIAPFVQPYKVAYIERKCGNVLVGGELSLPSLLLFLLLPMAAAIVTNFIENMLLAGAIVAGASLLFMITVMAAEKRADSKSVMALVEKGEGSKEAATVKRSWKQAAVDIFTYTVTMSSSALYLHPSQVALLNINTAGVVIYGVFAWLAVAVASFSLVNGKSVGDPNAWNVAGDMKSRPLYLLTLYLTACLLPLVGGGTDTSVILHYSILPLPLLWSVGLLPRFDIFLECLMEQVNVVLCSDSPRYSASRTTAGFILSTVSIVAVTLLEQFVVLPSVSQGASVFLSVLLSSRSAFLATSCLRNKQMNFNREAAVQPLSAVNVDAVIGREDPLRAKVAVLEKEWGKRTGSTGTAEVVGGLFLAAAVILPSLFLNSIPALSVVIISSGGAVGVLGTLLLLLLSLETKRQAGLPNPLSFLVNKSLSPKRGVKPSLLPLVGETALRAVSFIYLYFAIQSEAYDGRGVRRGGTVLSALALLRCYRSLCTSPAASAIDVCVSIIAVKVLGAPLPTPEVMLISNFIFARLAKFLSKLRFMYIYSHSTITEKKLMFEGALSVWYLNLCLSPLLLCEVALAALLDAPIVPVMGAPIYAIGFPRPRRMWDSIGSYSIGEEGSYYMQLLPHVMEALKVHLAPQIKVQGKMLLFRLEKMIFIVEVLEAGVGYSVVNMKGLELQEPTSCHNVEAGAIDAVLTKALSLGKGDGGGGGNGNGGGEEDHSLWNYNWTSALNPLTTVTLKAYSHSKVGLRGIMDNQEFLQLFHDSLWYSLTYVIMSHVHSPGGTGTGDRLPASWREVSIKKHVLLELLREDFPSLWVDHLNLHFMQKGAQVQQGKYLPVVVQEKEVEETVVVMETPASAPASASASATTYTSYASSFGKPSTPSVATTTPKKKAKEMEDFERMLDGGGDLSDEEDSFTPSPRVVEKKAEASVRAVPTVVAVAAAAPVPGPLQPVKVEKKVKKIIRSETIDDLAAVIGSCYAVVNVSGIIGSNPVQAGAEHILQIFEGDFPFSHDRKWLMERPDLAALVVKAIRLNLKLALDAFSLYELEYLRDHKALLESVGELEKEWLIGSASSPAWSQAIAQELPHLLQLTGKNNQYYLQQLGLHEEQCFVASLDRETVNSLWAMQTLDLLFFTNDDDERYSIQSHKSVLRNLVISAAEPPLGYPVFASGPVVI